MKLASYCIGNRPSWGIVEGGRIADVGADLAAHYPDLRSALAAEAFRRIVHAAPRAARIRVADVTWLPVIPNPAKILCVGLNYESHAIETGAGPPPYPMIFARYANSQLGHLRPVPLTPLSRKLDYEGELAVVIGRPGRYIPREEASRYVAGYACYNDMTVRDWQRHTLQFTPGKNFPETGAFGPWMVTPDEVGELQSLRLNTRVNGEAVQSARLGEMIFGVSQLIEYCSKFTRLEPGDVLVTGTPGGVGARRQPPVWLKPGDVTEVEIDGIGLLRNDIIDERCG